MNKRYFVFLLFLFFTTYIFAQNNYAVFQVKKSNKSLYGFMDKKNKVVIHPQYDSVLKNFKNDRAIVIQNNKVGIIDQKGRIIIPFNYKNILPESNGKFPVQNPDGLWGIYTIDGKECIPCNYNNFKLINKGELCLLQKDANWGIANMQNEILLPFKYKYIHPINNNTFEVKEFNLWKIKNAHGYTMHQFHYDSMYFFKHHYFKILVNNNYYVVDTTNTLVSRIPSEGIELGYDQLIKLCDDTKWGVSKLYNKSEWIVPAVYDSIEVDSLFIHAGTKIAKNMVWKLLDHTGKQVNAATFLHLDTLSNGRIGYQSTNHKWGYLDSYGKESIEPQYKKIGPFVNGRAEVTRNDSSFIIDKNNHIVIAGQDYQLYKMNLLNIDAFNNKTYLYQPDAYTELFPIDSFRIKIKQNNLYGLISNYGKTIIPCKYDELAVGDDAYTYCAKLKDKWVVVNTRGKEHPVDKRIVWMDGFYDGYAAMRFSNNNYGFVDLVGGIQIAPQYSNYHPFHNGKAEVMLNNNWGIIDKMERFIIQPYYDSIGRFVNDIAITKEKGLFYLLHSNGTEINKEGFEWLQRTKYGDYRYRLNNRVGILDKNGKEIISNKYEYIKILDKDLFAVKQNGVWGVIDRNRKIIVNINYDYIQYDAVLKLYLAALKGRVVIETIR